MKRIERWYAEAAGRRDGKTGSISIQQRFGSALNLNLHYHVIFLDGVYVRGADGRLSFRRVTPHTADVERLVVEIADACEAWLAEQGCGAEDAIEPGEDDAQAVLQQAALLGQATLGERAGRRARRVQRADTDFKGGWPSTACRGDPLAMGSGGVSSGSRRLDGSSLS